MFTLIPALSHHPNFLGVRQNGQPSNLARLSVHNLMPVQCKQSCCAYLRQVSKPLHQKSVELKEF